MKPLTLVVFAALSIAVGVAAYGNVPPPPLPPPAPVRAVAWEFKIVRMSPFPETDEKRMSELGAEGWELADTVQERGEGRVIMRRPRR